MDESVRWEVLFYGHSTYVKFPSLVFTCPKLRSSDELHSEVKSLLSLSPPLPAPPPPRHVETEGHNLGKLIDQPE